MKAIEIIDERIKELTIERDVAIKNWNETKKDIVTFSHPDSQIYPLFSSDILIKELESLKEKLK